MNPSDYSMILAELKKSGGSLPLSARYGLAKKTFAHTAEYDRAISEYLEKTSFEQVAACYGMEG